MLQNLFAFMEKRIILYTSNTCGKCKVLKPQIEEFLSNKKDVEYVLMNIDSKEGFRLALENEIYSLPTLIYMENNTVIKKFVSNFSIDDVKKLIGA